MQRYSFFNSTSGLKGLASAAIVEFSPPPGMTSSGKPDPASSKWMLTWPFLYKDPAAPFCPVCARTRPAAAIMVAAVPAFSSLRLVLSIGLLLARLVETRNHGGTEDRRKDNLEHRDHRERRSLRSLR